MFFFLAMISRIFWILFMTFQLHFLWVPPHHLVLPDLPTNQLEKNSCYEIHFFTENLFGFTKPPFMAPFEHCLSVAHSTCFAMFMHAKSRVLWQIGANLRLRGLDKLILLLSAQLTLERVTLALYTRLYSFKLSCRIVSFTAANTNRMFSVSVAQVKWE